MTTSAAMPTPKAIINLPPFRPRSIVLAPKTTTAKTSNAPSNVPFPAIIESA
jgi:hypothetical protein